MMAVFGSEEEFMLLTSMGGDGGGSSMRGWREGAVIDCSTCGKFSKQVVDR